MREAEDGRFVHSTLSNEQFVRIYTRFESDLRKLNDRLTITDVNYGDRIKSLDKILSLAENIGKAYDSADYHLKKQYLGLFFKSFKIRKGKVAKYELSEALKPLIKKQAVLITTTGLPVWNSFRTIKWDEVEKSLLGIKDLVPC